MQYLHCENKIRITVNISMDKTKMPLVSIVLITYNSARYVLEALESVKAQTWQQIELIISDDGSTDQTISLCSEWLVKNKHRFYDVQLITVANNTGIPSNCNRGLRAAHGDWIKTIAGDDILLPTCIADNQEYAHTVPGAQFIVSDIQEINEFGASIRDKVVNEGLLFIAGLPSAKKQLKAYTRWPVFLNVPTFFCNREVVERIGYCDETFRIFEDTTMVIRIMESGFKLQYMKKPTVAYRIHRNAVSRNMQVDGKREKEAMRVFLKYRMKHLSLLNPLDLSVFFESWLRFKYKGFHGHKGDSVLRKLSLFYWYMKMKGVKSY